VNEQPLTVLELLRRAESWFREQGISSPRLDAEVLLAEVRGCRRLDLYLRFDRPVTEPALSRFRDLSRERAKGAPVAYLLGRREFLSRSFAVDCRVLVPRPETEILVEEAVRRLSAVAEEAMAVDVGTGSGVISLSIAAACPRVRLLAIDASREALEVAKENARTLGSEIESRVEFLVGDLLVPLDGRGLEGSVELIASNPPYVSDADYERLPKDVKDFEPPIALRAGPQGTELHERLLLGAHRFLRSGASILMEIGAGQAARIRQLVSALPEYASLETLRDYQGIERVAIARRV
jgi:release factor glutamine methyltransferase